MQSEKGILINNKENIFTEFIKNEILNTKNFGNHTVVVIDEVFIGNQKYTNVVIDPTNPAIGFFENGVVYFVGQEETIKYIEAYLGTNVDIFQNMIGQILSNIQINNEINNASEINPEIFSDDINEAYFKYIDSIDSELGEN